MRTALGLALILSLALGSGCGNACDHENRAVNTANDRAKSCGSNATSTFDYDKCSSNLHACSQDDIAKIDNFANCLEALPSCPGSNSTSYDLAKLGCFSDLSGISGACLQTQ
jgi:hypothetical protein